MNRYLTDLAVQKRRWHIPAAALSLMFGIAGVSAWLEDSPADEDFLIWLSSYVLIVGLMLLPLFFIIRWRLRQRSASRIADALDGRGEAAIPLSELDRVLGIKGASRKVGVLKKCGFLQRIELDGGNLLLDNPAPAPSAPEASPAEEDFIGQIRRLNDEIADEAVSARIDRIEQVTASILQTVAERPERAGEARRFINYYLPVTLKLLESYRLMEKQSYQGENIRASRQRIDEVLDKLVAATERQQDRLFRSEALDVEAEISVLEMMMTSDGLIRPEARAGEAPD